MDEVTAGSGLSAATELQLVPEVDRNGSVTLSIESSVSMNQHYTASIKTLQDQTHVGTFNFRKSV